MDGLSGASSTLTLGKETVVNGWWVIAFLQLAGNGLYLSRHVSIFSTAQRLAAVAYSAVLMPPPSLRRR